MINLFIRFINKFILKAYLHLQKNDKFKPLLSLNIF